MSFYRFIVFFFLFFSPLLLPSIDRERKKNDGISLASLYLDLFRRTLPVSLSFSPISKSKRTRNSTASSTSGAASHVAWRLTEAAAEETFVVDNVVGGDLFNAFFDASADVEKNRKNNRSSDIESDAAAAATALAAVLLLLWDASEHPEREENIVVFRSIVLLFLGKKKTRSKNDETSRLSSA